MANQHYILKRNDTTPNTGATYWGAWICDTYAGRPVTGLVVGELGIMLDTGRIHFASSTTAWTATALFYDIGVVGGVYIYNAGSFATGHYIISAATSLLAGPIIPDDTGYFVLDGSTQTLSNKTLDGPTLVGPALFTTSGTGVVKIGELSVSNAYGTIGLAGDITVGNFNFTSSPGAPDLVINRPTGKYIAFRENNVSQMELLAGGALTGKMDTMTYAATITLDVTLGNTHKTTLTGNATINASAAGSGDQHMTVILVNDATLARTTTFGTNFRSAGVVVGTISKVAVVKFVSDGAAWFEESRTLAL